MWFERIDPARIALEVGTHSPWISRLLLELGHDVIVANPRKVRMIYASTNKSDRFDAQALARLARLDPALLSGIRHRGEQVQQDLTVIQARELLVRTRTRLVNHIRGAVKSVGERIPRCSAASFHHKAPGRLPAGLKGALLPLVEHLESVTGEIRRYDHRIKVLTTERYPETEMLRQVPGVGPITSLTFILTLEDPNRFKNSRAVGPYLGLCPRRNQSGLRDPQCRITKAGNGMLRRLLVQAAQYQLGPFGPDTDLRRWGLARAERGGKAARKKAVIGVARKLAILLHHLWQTGEAYEPLRNSENHEEVIAEAA
jgi:transposase